MFGDKNVGNAKAVTVSGLSLSGTDAGNYTLIQPTSLVADITAATPTPTPTHNSDSVGEMAHIIVHNNTIDQESKKFVAMETPKGEGYFSEKGFLPTFVNGGVALPQGVFPDIDDTTITNHEGH